jgi:cytosine deaminase
MFPPLLLRNVLVEDRGRVNVLLDRGVVARLSAEVPPVISERSPVIHDLSGYLLLPGAADPHVHLDKALLWDRLPNRSGDLLGGIEAVRRAFGSMTERDVTDRARLAIKTAVANGYSALRTHVTCEKAIGTTSLRALCSLREAFADVVQIQVVAMIGAPITGKAGEVNRAILREAIDLGSDGVGGAPALDEDPAQAIRFLVEIAAAAGLFVDLHLDETTDPDVLTLPSFVSEVVRCGMVGRATASHCVSLGQQSPEYTMRLAKDLAAAGIGVVTLPQTNLLLQGRRLLTRVPRGLTAVAALRAAGVVVAGGGDNWRDPYNPLGRMDPLETAALLVAAAHLSPRDAYAAVSVDARRIMGITPNPVEVDGSADLLAICASSLNEAVAGGTQDRWVFKNGQLVARTRVVHDLHPGSDTAAPSEVTPG